MAGKAPYTRERPRMKCFLEVIVHWRMIIWLFTYAMSPVNLKKKTFPLQFCEIFLFRIAWKTTSCESKKVIAIYGSFCEIDAFPLGVDFQFAISICAIWRVMEMQIVMVILKSVCWSVLASKSGLVCWFLRSFGQVSACQAGSLASQPAKH